MNGLQQYDAGTVVSVAPRDTDGDAIPLVSGMQAWFLVESPNGRRKRFVATVDIGAQVVTYTTGSHDFDEWGTWRIQVELVNGPQHIRSAVQRLAVRSNLDVSSITLYPDVALFVVTNPIPTAGHA